jgi:mannose-6-phosphate isomerase-like protein (cupin superfamily)
MDTATLGPMKRHPALVPLSHDHHHALVEARRLRRAATDDEDPAAAVAAFRRFFATVTIPHFREEEESLFPLVVDAEEARPLLVEALLDHQRLHALVATLDGSDDLRASMHELGERLEKHVRLEERELFPLIERLAPIELEELDGVDEALGGPVWGMASEDLNATLLAWGAGEGPPEHVNDERDVLIFVADGSAKVTVDSDEHELAAGEASIVEKGRRRRITAGPGGVRYLSVHLRRPMLEIQPLSKREA